MIYRIVTYREMGRQVSETGDIAHLTETYRRLADVCVSRSNFLYAICRDHTGREVWRFDHQR